MKSLLATVLMLGFASGCAEREESVAETTGAKVGEVLTDFASGVGEGVDKQLEVTVELSAQCSEAGLSKTVAKSLSPNKEGIAVYFISEKPFVGQMVAKAVNADEQEIGRSTIDVEFESDDAQYVTFTFGSEVDSQLVEKYLVDIRPPSNVDAEAKSREKSAPIEDR